MKHEDFSIGLEFYSATGKWRCTDIGPRTIVAIQIDQVTVVEYNSSTKTIFEQTVTHDQSWFNGLPYAVAERVFDEYDVAACHLESEIFSTKIND